MEEKKRFLGSGRLLPLRKNMAHTGLKGLLGAFMLLSAATGAKAAESPAVKFNTSVRYSQWAIDSRGSSFYANTTSSGLAKFDASGNKTVARSGKAASELDYVPGLVAKSMIEAADYYQDFDWSKPWFLSVKEYGDAYYNSVANTGGSLDDLNAVKLYIGIYNDKAYASDADKTNATTALDRAKAGLIAHNKSYSIQSGTLAGDDVVGGWFHKADYNNQMWLDGAYMGSALLAQLTDFYGSSSNVFGSKDADWNMVAKQLNIVWNMCWDSSDKLMYHAFEANAGTATSNSNANTWYGLNGKTQPYTFHSAAYWGRANAWYLFALVDVLEAMKNDGQENTTNYTTLKQHLTDLAAGIKARQSSEGGWYQLLDKDNTFTATSYNGKSGNVANYIETSATTLFSAAFFKAVRLGLLDDTYKDAARKAFELVVDDYTYLDANNNLEIWGSSRSAGLGGKGSNYVSGGKSFRDGSNEYYLLGSDVTMVKQSDGITEGKVLGGFIMAATEYERAYLGQDSKRVLFAYDLAPEYDFSTTAGSIKAEAYGNGTVTYEWFKAKAKDSSTGTGVTGATSDTFTPTEDGYYFCSAKDENGATAQTRTTYVKANKSATGGDDDATSGTVTFTGDDLKAYKSPMTDATKTVTITTSTGSISGESAGDIKVAKNAAFTISVPEGKYIKSIVYTLKSSSNGELTLSPAGTKSSDNLTYTTIFSDNTLTSVTATNAANKGGIQVTSITVEYASTSSEPTTTQYTVTASAQLDGTVKIMSGDKEIESGSKVDKGTALTFTASLPSQGTSMYDFEGWTVNNKDIEGTDKTYTVASLESDINVVARIKRARANVYILASSYGTTTATLNETALENGALVDLGSKVVFTATPESGYKFSCWEIKGDGDTGLSGNFTDNPYTVTIDHDYSMKAKFEKEGETPVTANSTFGLDDLKTLDSNPVSGEVNALNNGDITITATKGIDANTNGLKMSSSTTFTIEAANNAKISKITVVQSATNRECTYSPTYSEKTSDTDNKKFVYTYNDNKPSQITVTGPSSLMYITSIVVEYETTASKTNITASFATSEVKATVGDAAVDLPALTVNAGDKTLTLTTDYTVTYKSNDENVAKVADGKVEFIGKGNTTIDATITPVNTSLYNSTTASFNVNVTEKTTPVDPTQESVVYDFKTTVGTTTEGKNCTVSTDNIKFGSDFRAAEGKYITIAPSVSGGFKAGDVITLHGVCDNKKNKSGVVIYSDVNAESSIFKTNAFATTANGGSDYTFTLTEDCDNLYFGRFGGGTAYITALTVKRPAATGKTRLSAAFATASSVVANTTQSVSLPALTVKAGDKELSNEEYTVEYASNATDVATISGNVITVIGTGTATITATITPTDADTYVGTTATYQLTVKKPTALNITIPDVTMNVTDANYKQPEIKVYGDDDKLLTLGTDYKLEYEVESGSNVTVDNDGVFKPTGEQYKWTEGQTVFTVTAIPTTELGNTYTAGTLRFAYSVVTGKATPAFMAGFANGTIKLHKDGDKRYFTVPLIYAHEDVSDDFDYTYSIGGKAQTITKNTHTMEYKPSAEGTFEVTVSAKAKVLYPNDEDKKVDYGEVYNDPDPITFTLDVKEAYDRISVTLDPAKVDLYTGTTESAPDVTVTKFGTDDVLDDSKYTLRWIVNNDAYARVDATTGRIEGVEEGSVKGRCSVTGNNIESTTAFFDINVDDPARYRAKDVDNDNKRVKYGNQAPLWNQNKDLQVVLGGWMFPQDVTSGRDLVSGEGLKSSYKWSDYAGQAKWRLSGFAYMVNGNDQKNARQENAANAMAQSTTLYDADFKNVGSIKDQMFGVPCSGSYLVFNPKTAGVVTAHIFQNGVFDAKGKDYQYRPQRRVFVMDEAGNVVSTDADIENTNGKPTGGIYDLSSYKWDINNDAAPTADEVNSHFKGLTDFNMNATDGASSFKNNVYESTFGASGSLVINPAADDNVKGSHGWSVLADSPVTYTFRVKPGKTYYLYNYGSKIGFYGFSFAEEKGQTVDNVEYDEASTNNNVEATAEGHVAQVTVKRATMKAGQWSPCVLPFSLNKAQVDAIFGETYSASKPDGTQILYFDRIEGDRAVFVRHAYNTIVAGKPFIIKPTKDVESINTADCAEYPYVTIENTKPQDWCAGNGYAWVSSYNNDMTVKAGDCFISGSKGEFMNYTGADAPMKGFRGYLKRTGNGGVQEVKQLRAMTGSNVSDDTTSAIEGIFIDSDGSAAAGVVANGKVYNMSGQVVGSSAAALKTLPSGVYMLNGKKIVK